MFWESVLFSKLNLMFRIFIDEIKKCQLRFLGWIVHFSSLNSREIKYISNVKIISSCFTFRPPAISIAQGWFLSICCCNFWSQMVESKSLFSKSSLVLKWEKNILFSCHWPFGCEMVKWCSTSDNTKNFAVCMCRILVPPKI